MLRRLHQNALKTILVMKGPISNTVYVYVCANSLSSCVWYKTIEYLNQTENILSGSKHNTSHLSWCLLLHFMCLVKENIVIFYSSHSNLEFYLHGTFFHHFWRSVEHFQHFFSFSTFSFDIFCIKRGVREDLTKTALKSVKKKMEQAGAGVVPSAKRRFG